MRQYIFDGSQMGTLEEAYTHIARVLNFPEYFGRNLDALEECLKDVTEREGQVGITIHQASHPQSLPEWPSLLAILSANEKISLTLH